MITRLLIIAAVLMRVFGKASGWRSADKGTAGCMAMARPGLDDVVAGLDVNKRPVLVQLPAVHDARVAKAWALPSAAPPG